MHVLFFLAYTQIYSNKQFNTQNDFKQTIKFYKTKTVTNSFNDVALKKTVVKFDNNLAR